MNCNSEFTAKKVQNWLKVLAVKTAYITPGSPWENSYCDMLSAAFASNLDWIMKENDNLVLWCHGHVHSDVDFTKYGTRVVCCPFGYYNENNKDIADYGLIIDTDKL